jgi:hypothetical protein
MLVTLRQGLLSLIESMIRDRRKSQQRWYLSVSRLSWGLIDFDGKIHELINPGKIAQNVSSDLIGSFQWCHVIMLSEASLPRSYRPGLRERS